MVRSDAMSQQFLHVCPILKDYTQDELQQGLLELATLPADSELRRMRDDYLDLRDQVRACRRH